LPEDEKGDLTGSPNTTPAADLKIYEDDWFIGEKRALAKTSFAHAKVRTFRNIKALLENLPASDNTMRHYDPPLDNSSPRTPEEMINVGVCTSIIAAKKEPDHDYHMIIGDVGGPYLIAEVSGIPRRGDRYTQDVLLNLRRAFENFIASEHRSGKNYSGWGDPLPVYIEGSLFYDITRRKVEGGPKFAKTETLWEIHPVTKIIFEPEHCP
jgi:hypothetical protein